MSTVATLAVALGSQCRPWLKGAPFHAQAFSAVEPAAPKLLQVATPTAPMGRPSYSPKPPGEIHSLPWRPVSLTPIAGFAASRLTVDDPTDSAPAWAALGVPKLAPKAGMTVGWKAPMRSATAQ